MEGGGEVPAGRKVETTLSKRDRDELLSGSLVVHLMAVSPESRTLGAYKLPLRHCPLGRAAGERG